MPNQRLIRVLLAAAVAGVNFCAAALGRAAEVTTGPQTSQQGAVTVTVAPHGFPQKAATWDFDVSLNTHTQPLDDDLTKSATLVVDGKAYRPTSWEGSPPGGHHRKGVLRFPAVAPLPAAVELQIQRSGEKSPRTFRWSLK